jgi:hypothetical protein
MTKARWREQEWNVGLKIWQPIQLIAMCLFDYSNATEQLASTPQSGMVEGIQITMTKTRIQVFTISLSTIPSHDSCSSQQPQVGRI